MSLTQCLTMTKPDDWHLDVLDAVQLRRVLPEHVRRFASGQTNLSRDFLEVARS